jgi:hypothetical protein
MSHVTPIAIPLRGNALFIDNSTMEKFVTCPRSAQYFVGAKRTANRSRAALTFGQIIHKVLEVRYRRPNVYADAVVLGEMVKALDEGFKTYQPDVDEFRNYDMGIRLIREYLATYPLEDFEPLSISGVPFVEQPFAIPLGELDIGSDMLVRDLDTGRVEVRHLDVIQIVWTGRIDLAYRREGRLYLLDHKTTSVLGPQFFYEFEISHQVYGYSWAIHKLLGEYPSAFVINALGVRKPTKTGKAIELIRQGVPVFPELVVEWEQDTLHIVSDFIEMIRRGYMPKHTKWCQGKYGQCEFKGVCNLTPDMRQVALMSNEYKDVTWDPLNPNSD